MLWTIIVLLVVASWIGAFVLNLRENDRSKRFRQFLVENAEALMNGSGRDFEGYTYKLDTKLVQYQFAVSVISMSMTRGTSFHPSEKKRGLLIVCTLISAFGGWWGIPWGPYYTVVSFINNAKAQEVTVQQLIPSTQGQDLDFFL